MKDNAHKRCAPGGKEDNTYGDIIIIIIIIIIIKTRE